MSEPVSGTGDGADRFRTIVMWCMVGILLWTVGYSLLLFFTVYPAARDAKESAGQSVTETLTNRESGFKNRALQCTLLVAHLGEDALPDNCKEPEVLRYYNPHQVQVVVCDDIRALGLHTEKCP